MTNSHRCGKASRKTGKVINEAMNSIEETVYLPPISCLQPLRFGKLLRLRTLNDLFKSA